MPPDSVLRRDGIVLENACASVVFPETERRWRTIDRYSCGSSVSFALKPSFFLKTRFLLQQTALINPNCLLFKQALSFLSLVRISYPTRRLISGNPSRVGRAILIPIPNQRVTRIG